MISHTIGLLTLLLLIYCFYQLLRNQLVYKIRIKWIEKDDDRYYKYSYSKMMTPNKSNWWGLKYPKDKHFK